MTYYVVGFGDTGKDSCATAFARDRSTEGRLAAADNWNEALVASILSMHSPLFKTSCTQNNMSLLQQPGPKKFKLFKIELIYKAKKFKVPLFTI